MTDRGGHQSRSPLGRRQLLGATLAGAGGIAALGLAGCGGGSDQRPASSSSNGGGAIDSTKGKPGGTLVIQGPGDPGTFDLIARSNAANTKVAGLVTCGLLAFNFGRPPSNGVDVVPEPDLATALPEQPDEVTLVFKLRPGVQFHNGRALTSDDVKYSFGLYQTVPSGRQAYWQWIDRIDTPDATTVVVTSKGPFADAVVSLTAHNDAFIVAREVQETPQNATTLMGAGPYIFEQYVAGVGTTLRKNPNFYLKPYPYIEKITVLGATDSAKQVADFSARNVGLTFWHSEELADEIKRNRPDAKVWPYQFAGHRIYMRTDQPPFNDKRLRQALSMAIDRKAIRDAVSKGQGEEDQIFSWANGPTFGFRKPRDLGASAKYWQHDVQAAKQLAAAAGFDKPIDTMMSHYDATVIGQPFIDTATLLQAQWRAAGIANVKDNTQPYAQYSSTTAVGNYEGMGMVTGLQFPVMGITMKNYFWSPPEGVRPPTPNQGRINDPQLSALLDKQLIQFNTEERRQTFKALEELMAEQM
jgi:peptide/nickel transport system substrate-binding protein